MLGFSLVQAAIFGSLIGALVSLRPRPGPGFEADSEDEPRVRWRTVLGAPVDALERALYDWRVRELGRRSDPADAVVLAGVDEETLAAARGDARLEVAAAPWPRAVLGRIVEQLGREGARGVAVDWSFSDRLPDDEAFRTRLDAAGTPTALGFTVSSAPPPPVLLPLRSVLVLVGLGDAGRPEGTWELLRRVLAERRPAFAVPDGRRIRVWAGVASEEEARQLARRWNLPAPALTREFSAGDRAFQATAEDLLVSLAEVSVIGLDASALPLVRSLQPPAAPLLGPGSRFGHTALAPDADGRVRGIYHLVRWISGQGRQHVLPSLSLATALALGPREPLRYASGRLVLPRGGSIPIEPNGYGLLRFDAAEPGRNGRGSLARAVSVWRLLLNVFDLEARVPAHYRNEVQHRAVVLAQTSREAGFRTQTPLGPGVTHGAVVGQALANVLGSAGLQRAPVRTDVLATFGLAFAGAFLALSFSGLFRSLPGALAYFASIALAVAAELVWVRHAFLADGRVLAAGGPLLALGASFAATTLYALRTERQMRDFVYGALGRYVSADIADQVFRNVELMRPQRRKVTICSVDLESFGALAERLPPESVVGLLNAWFTELTHKVRQTGGHVEYVGDGLLAFWGAPVKLERHAQVACRAALEMRAEIQRRAPEWERRFGVPVRCRMGLHSGEVVAGDMGSALKSNYTVLGDAVATVHRIEAANRAYSTAILASTETVQLAEDAFYFREVDEVWVAGGPRFLFELLGRRGEAPPPHLAGVLESWDGALRLYRARAFEEAKVIFSRHAGRDPVSAHYARMCDGYLQTPPPPDWTGQGDLRRMPRRG